MIVTLEAVADGQVARIYLDRFRCMASAMWVRYIAHPAFVLGRLREIDSEYPIFESIKLGQGGSVSLVLVATLTDRASGSVDSAAAPSRHRYQGLLAPNAPLRAQVRLRRNSSRPNNGIFGYLTVGSWPLAA
jgi:hypothetical protein